VLLKINVHEKYQNPLTYHGSPVLGSNKNPYENAISNRNPVDKVGKTLGY